MDTPQPSTLGNPRSGETNWVRATATSASLQSDPWGWWRNQMPVTEKWAYLDHAAVAPLTLGAASAIQNFVEQATLDGDTVWPQWAARLDDLRGRTAMLLGADVDEISLVANTTAGINLVAEGYPWQPGDNVLVPEGEFPSNLYPWLNQQAKGVEVRIVPRQQGRVLIDDLIAQCDASTRIIAASWVGYASGFRLDVAELVERAHQRGVLVFLDAIQGLGMYPLDLSQVPVDFLAADGHKWLLGPEGAGIAMIRSQHLDMLRCVSVGWNSVKNSHQFAQPELQLRSAAARFEGGSANMVGLAALSASLELFLAVNDAHGPAAIADRVISLAAYLDTELNKLGVRTRIPANPQRRSGIVTFDVPGHDPAEVRQAAIRHRVVVSCRDGGVRASIHAYNDQADLDQLVAAVSETVTG